MGGDQAIRGDGHGYFHRHCDLPHRRRPRQAGHALAERFFPTRSYGVVVRKGKYLSPQARAFIELIQPDLFTPRGYDESGDSER